MTILPKSDGTSGTEVSLAVTVSGGQVGTNEVDRDIRVLLRSVRLTGISGSARPTHSAWIDGRAVSFESAREKFAVLVSVWREKRPRSARLMEALSHPCYQQIIGMGPEAIPLLMEELRTSRDQWTYALHCISGEDPVPEGVRDGDEIRRMWIKWGIERGFVPN